MGLAQSKSVALRVARQFLFLLVCLPFGSLANSLVDANGDIESGVATTRATVIPVAEIINRASEDQRLLIRVEHKLKEKTPETLLAESLDDLSRSIDEKKLTFYSEQLNSLSVARLEGLDRYWQFDARRFARWQSDMQHIASPYTKLSDELAQRYVDWAATKAAYEAESLPNALVNQINNILADIRSTEQSLSQPLDQLGKLAQRASLVDASIQTGRRDVAAAIESIDLRLFQNDLEPLWRIESWRNASEDSLKAIKQGLEIEQRFAHDYSANNGSYIHGLRLLQIMLFILLIWLAKRYSHAPAVIQDEATARIIRRPISSWLLLSMLIVMVAKTDAPLLLMELTLLIAFIPLLRLLPKQSLRLLDAWPYAVMGLFALGRFGLLLMDSTYLYRLFVLGIAVIALVITIWLQWRWRHHAHAGMPIRVRIRAFGWVAAMLLVVAILVNCMGNISLAEMLVSGLIDSSYMGLLLYTGVMVCAAFLKVLTVESSLTKLMLVNRYSASIQQLMLRLLVLASVMGWAIYTMDRFRVFRPFYTGFTKFLNYSLEVGEFSIGVGNILVFTGSVLMSFWFAGLVRLVLHEQLHAHKSLSRGVGNSIASLSYYVVLLLGFLIALSVAGFKVSQLALVFGALGVGIGFGLQNIVNNFVSGLVLMFERPIQPGDIVEMNGITGRVRQIGMRATVISTFEGADVVVPNGSLVSNNLINWTLMDNRRRIDIDVGVAYGTDLQKLLPLLVATASATPGISNEPAPVALMKGYGASSLDFVVRAWTSDMDSWVQIRSNLFARILTALTEAGIEIPFSQHDLHLRSISDEVGSILRNGEPKPS